MYFLGDNFYMNENLNIFSIDFSLCKRYNYPNCYSNASSIKYVFMEYSAKGVWS